MSRNFYEIEIPDLFSEGEHTYNSAVPVDASQNVVGVAISHVYRNGLETPVLFASRTLTDSEEAHAQIDKKVPAIAFGVKNFLHVILFWSRIIHHC